MKATKESKKQHSRIIDVAKSSQYSKIAQRQRRIIGSQSGVQNSLIGINLMPSGGLREVLPGNGRGYSSLSNKIAGHTSIISQSNNNFSGRGFSPNGWVRSVLVGITGFLPFLNPIDVQGNYHREPRDIIEDPRAIQLLIPVTQQTQQIWEDLMGNEGVGGIYSYSPQSAMVNNLDGIGSDNCTTIAIRNAIHFTIILLKDGTVAIDDKTNLLILKNVLESMMEQVVNQNLNRNTSVGTQGRTMRAMSDIWTLNDRGQ